MRDGFDAGDFVGVYGEDLLNEGDGGFEGCGYIRLSETGWVCVFELEG